MKYSFPGDTPDGVEPSTREAKGRRPGPPWLESLAEQLADEMSRAWSRGGQPTAEEFLARHPEFYHYPEIAARVIYEEICLREGLGQGPGSTELMSRFPQWRSELRMMLDCHGLVRPGPVPSALPALGETLVDYRIHSILGRGRRGHVFLATQITLADRPVVLKITRREVGHEHLALARIQHPHVVPLYAVHDFPDRDLRALCMPYLGGTTLDRVLATLEDKPPARRSGTDILRVLDQSRTGLLAPPAWSGPRQFFAEATYFRSICWVVACLAEALHAVHTRGILHLDLKPSNVLITDDGQPMLLDFHLAQRPLEPGSARPVRLGGTYGFMSPEQASAMDALLEGRPFAAPVDRRSDIYSLGFTLYEALAGSLPPDGIASPARLLRANPRIDVRVARMVARCLDQDPSMRYPDAAALAAELRLHLRFPPLQGLPRRALGGFWPIVRRALGRPIV